MDKRQAATLGQVIAQIWVLTALAIISWLLGLGIGTLPAFGVFHSVSNAGRGWFRYHSLYYTQTAAIINGITWGLVLGIVYYAGVRFLYLSRGFSIALLIWGTVGASYSGYRDPTSAVAVGRRNLDFIMVFAIVVFLIFSATVYFIHWS